MGYMTEEQYNLKMEKIQKRNTEIERRKALRKERTKHIPKIKLPSTSKIILIIVFLICIEIIIFAQYVMLVLGDVSALYVLIGVATTLVPIVVSYYSKSKAENKKDGIVYEMAMLEKMNDSENAKG